MARYKTSVSTPLSAADAFAYMADIRHFVDWDPGITRVVPLNGTTPQLGASYELTVKPLGTTVMRYEITEFKAPNRLVLESRTFFLTSLDVISVEPSGSGSIVTYDAELTFRRPLQVFDPFLNFAFRFLGNRAAAGLKRVLSESSTRKTASTT